MGMETYRKRFRLKKGGAEPPIMQPPALDRSGIAGGSGRKRFALQKKLAEVSNGLASRNPATDAEFSKVSNISRPEERKAYLDDQGRLRIPLTADDKYRWWAGGQSVLAILLELGASDKEIEAHIGRISTPESWRQWREMEKMRQKIGNSPGPFELSTPA